MKRSLLHRMALILMLELSGSAPIVAQAKDNPPGDDRKIDLETILDTMKTRASKFNSFDVAWRGTQTVTLRYLSSDGGDELRRRGVNGDQRVEFPVEGRFAQDGKGRIRIESLAASLALDSLSQKTKKSVEVFDGQIKTTFFAEGATSYPAAFIARAQLGQIAKKAALLPLRMILCPFNDEYGLFPADRSAFTLSFEVVDKIPCAKLVTKQHHVWLSTLDNQFLPIRHHLVSGTRVAIAFDFSYLSGVGHGFPIHSWKQTSWDAEGKMESEIDVSIVRFTANPLLRDTDFQIAFPAGTWVSDPSKNEKYLIKPDGSHRPILPGEFTGSNYEELLATDPPKPPSRSRFVLGLAAGILLAVGASYYFYRRGSRSRAA